MAALGHCTCTWALHECRQLPFRRLNLVAVAWSSQALSPRSHTSTLYNGKSISNRSFRPQWQDCCSDWCVDRFVLRSLNSFLCIKGATRGIGQSLALALASAGADLVLLQVSSKPISLGWTELWASATLLSEVQQTRSKL